MATNYYKDLKQNYPDIIQTDLWKYLETNDEEDYAHTISPVCYNAIEACETITELLPNFTKHDKVHIKGVCDWIAKLLGDKIDILTKEEAAVLIMSACCHDVGMSLSKNNKDALLKELDTGNLGEDLEGFLKNNSKINREYTKRKRKADNSELYERIIRAFIRQRHHLRIEEELDDDIFNGLEGALRKELVISICKSHGENLEKMSTHIDDTGVRTYLLAVLLRLADILNFDCSRSPKVKFIHAGLTEPKTEEERISSAEYIKNTICKWDINGRNIICGGKCPNSQIEHDILDYVEWVKTEVASWNRLIDETGLKKSVLNVVTKFTRDYEEGDYKLTVNAQKVIELLGSENVYGDRRAFLMELIQNAIDAILVRANIDDDFDVEKGKIDIYLWEEDGYLYVRIDDNGIGMNKDTLKRYFLTVGDSYYKSDEFKSILEKAKRKFTPMNRFGIGVLSCFMDKETSMQVETKNVEKKKVYRMDITSLDGYYTLYEIKNRRVNSLLAKPASIENMSDGYNRKPGTSICVRKKENSETININECKQYILENLKFPLFDVYVNSESGKYHKFETEHLVKRQDFLTEIDKIMDGKRFKVAYDKFEIIYLDNLCKYVPSNRLRVMNERLLLDCKAIFIIPYPEKKYLIYRDEYSNREYIERVREDIGKWLIESAKELSEVQRAIFQMIVREIEDKSFLTYNGMVHYLSMRDTYLLRGFYFTGGGWFDKVNLSKSKLIDKDKEIEALANIKEQLSYDEHYYFGRMQDEIIDIIEERMIEREKIKEKNEQIMLKGVGRDRVAYYDLKKLTRKYNLHAVYNSKKPYYLTMYYHRNDSFSRVYFKSRDHYIERFAEMPRMIIDNNKEILFWEEWINLNHPLARFLMEEQFDFRYGDFYEIYNELSHIWRSDTYGKRMFSTILHKLKKFMKHNSELFNQDLLEFMNGMENGEILQRAIVNSKKIYSEDD